MTDTHSLLHTSLAFLPTLDISSGGLTSGVSGGSVYLGAGQATGVGSIGGSIEIATGGSASTGGSVSIQDASGKIVIASNSTILDSTSGNILINSGSSSGTQGSGNGKYTSSSFLSSCLCFFACILAAISNTLPFIILPYSNNFHWRNNRCTSWHSDLGRRHI